MPHPIRPRPNRGTMRYRPDIDGLRAVAILAVALFHADVPPFSGGFVGVDIFFVISGFLITSILWRDIHDGGFSVLSFYDRRICRILPALFAVVLVSTGLAVVLLTPSDLDGFGRSVVASALFASNILFWRESGYFEAPADDKPLLHTWSLSVEEQFYIVWPVLLAVLVRIRSRRLLPALILVGLLLSLGLAEWAVRRLPDAAFYLAPTRAWELLLGALLALPLIPACRTRRVADLLAVLGIALIAYSVTAFDASTRFPGFAALAPCLGAALLIYSGTQADSRVARALSWRPIVFIGLVSYSFYLWHWPVLVFGRYYLNRDLAWHEAFLLLGIAFAAAVLSWRYVERPFRTGVRPWRRLPVSIPAAVAVILASAGAGLALHASEGLPGRVPSDVLAADAARDSVPPLTGRCHVEGPDLPPEEDCIFGAPGDPGTYSVVLWGDSHADHYAPAIAWIAEQRGLRVREITKSACPPLPGAQRIDSDGRWHQDCERFNAAAFDLIRRKPGMDLVILGARWALYAETTRFGAEGGASKYLATRTNPELSPQESRRVFARRLEHTVAGLMEAGMSVVILGQVPEFGYEPSACLARSRMYHHDAGGCALTAAAVQDRQRYINATLRRLADGHPRVSAFFPTEALCDHERCRAALDDIALYRDDDHLTVEGARRLAPYIEPALAAVHTPGQDRRPGLSQARSED